MPFLFNPCRPCCTIPKCKICGELSLPRSWNVVFGGSGTDTSAVDAIDDGVNVCSKIFTSTIATFDAAYNVPCRWKSSKTIVLKNCEYGSDCEAGSCICDCTVCFRLSIGTIRRAGANSCNDIAWCSKPLKATYSTAPCVWSAFDPGVFGLGVTMSLAKPGPPTITLSTTDASSHVWTATYACDEDTCQEAMAFSLVSSTTPSGQQPNAWPGTIVAAKMNCLDVMSSCLCPGTVCWQATANSLSLLPAFVTDAFWGNTNTIGVTPAFLDSTINPAGAISFTTNDGTCRFTYSDGFSLLPPDQQSGFVKYTRPGLTVEGVFNTCVLSGPGMSRRGIIVTLTVPAVFVNRLSNPQIIGANNNYITTQLYAEDIGNGYSECGAYDSLTLKWVSPSETMGACSILSAGAITNLFANFTGPGDHEYIVEWPDSLTFTKVGCTSSYSDPVFLPPTPVPPFNVPTGIFFTDDLTVSVEITVQDGSVIGQVTAVYTNRCKDKNNPTQLRDVKRYTMDVEDFDCLGSNVLSLIDSASGNVCNNWPRTITITP